MPQRRTSDDIAIKVENLGKCYRIYKKPKDRLKQAIWRGRKKYYDEFWALRHVSAEIMQGESVGIIGRNGSGKSTLLQMISGTLTPTEGSSLTNGRIGALLELGTGFNPEFTGLENIRLNGALLGLSSEEISDRMENILAFADIGDFVYQPIRTYSTGMTLRLAFSVLAHTDPEVLIIDEALAVGDAVFTQRCMRFIHAARDRCALLFVSHDPASISSLCEKCLWLHHGQVKGLGATKTVLDAYLRFCYASNQSIHDMAEPASTSEGSDRVDQPGGNASQEVDAMDPSPPPTHAFDGRAQERQASSAERVEWESSGFGDGAIRITEVCLTQQNSPSEPVGPLRGGELLRLRVKASCMISPEGPSICGFLVRDRLGLVMFGENTSYSTLNSSGNVSPEAGQELECSFVFVMPALKSGEYSVSIGWASGSQQNHVQNHYLQEALTITSIADSVRPIHGRFATDVLDASIALVKEPHELE